MWARPLLGPYVSDPMHLQLSNNYVGIFVGVNYGGGKGWKYCWSQQVGRARGRRVMHADFFTRGGVVGPPEGEGEFGRHIVSTHGEEKFGDERASCRYGVRCIISLILHTGLGTVSSH